MFLNAENAKKNHSFFIDHRQKFWLIFCLKKKGKQNKMTNNFYSKYYWNSIIFQSNKTLIKQMQNLPVINIKNVSTQNQTNIGFKSCSVFLRIQIWFIFHKFAWTWKKPKKTVKKTGHYRVNQKLEKVVIIV